MKILFVNHSCSRTGAPYVLLYFLQWLKDSAKDIEFDVVSLGDGPLEGAFDEVANYHYKPFVKKNLFYRIIRFFLRKVRIIKLYNDTFYDYELNQIVKKNYDIIYHNTVDKIQISTLIKDWQRGMKLIVHIHELEHVIQTTTPNLMQYILDIDKIITCSKLVQLNLQRNWNVKDSDCIYEFSKKMVVTSERIQKDKILIGGSGFVSERKGVDLFIQVAYQILQQISSVHEIEFKWIGAISNVQENQYNSLLNDLGLVDYFTFSGEYSDVNSFYKEADIFLMTSREDPFPLVCIEAGSYGIPIFLFDGATGTQEVMTDLEYLISPQFDTKDMANKVIALINNHELYKSTSAEMIKRFSQFTIENQSQQLLKVIQKVALEQ